MRYIKMLQIIGGIVYTSVIALWLVSIAVWIVKDIKEWKGNERD
jgi:hypothetical protein